MDNGKIYDSLKYVALVVLPMLAALYFGLGQIWHFPAIEEVIGSLTVIDTVLGIFLNKSSKDYRQQPVGSITVTQDLEGLATGLKFAAYKDPFILPDQQNVVFEVKREQQSE